MTSISNFGTAELTVGNALEQLLRHPGRQLIANWNWKSALFSALNRGTIFLVATLKRGTVGMSVAVGVEIVFASIANLQCIHTGPAIRQTPLVGEPDRRRRTACILLVLDYLVHRYTGMQHLRASMIFLGFWSSLASLFNLFIMRHGVWLIGSQSEPLWRDLLRMPILIASFVAVGPRWLWKQVAGTQRSSLESLS